MSTKPFGVAVVGYGGMGGWHTETIARIPEITLLGIHDIKPAREDAAREKDIHVYPSLEAVLADPVVELITIATPNDIHLPIALAAMNAGKNVICEKPVALNSGELSQMTACAEKNGVLFMVHQNRRWDKDFLIAKKFYDEGTLGPVFNMESRVHGSRGIPGDWRNKKAHGGGMVLDWGVHLIDQMMLMMGDRKLESLYATLSNVTNEEVDDGFRTIFHFEGGLIFLIEVGTSNFINLPRWYIQGENGSAQITDWDLNGEIVMVSDWEKRDAVPVVTEAGLTKTMAPRTEETIQKYPLPAVESEIRDFYRNAMAVVRDGAEPKVKNTEVMKVMRVMEAIFASAEKGQSVRLNADCTLK